MAVDDAGALYISDTANKPVLPAGSDAPAVLHHEDDDETD